MKISIYLLLSIGFLNAFERPEIVNPRTEKKLSESLSLNNSRVKSLLERQQPIKTTQARREIIEKTQNAINGESESILKGETLPWLGVLGEPLNDTLRMQLGIKSGIVLKIVEDESPAYISGLRAHDILYKVDGYELTDQDTLREVIQNSNVESEIELRAISKGKKVNFNVKLIEKIVNKSPSSQKSLDDILPLEIRDALSSPLRGELKKKGADRIFKEMGFEKLFDEVTPKNFNLDFNSSDIIQMEDGEGSIKIQVVNGAKNVTLTDSNGNIKYKGSWDSEEDQAKIPREIRERINGFDLF